jgi:hypothetical protein
VVVIFAYSKSPSILRQQGKHFLFIGSAHIHELMDRELWAGAHPDLQQCTLL